MKRQFYIVSGHAVQERYVSIGSEFGTRAEYIPGYDLINTSTIGPTVVRTYEYQPKLNDILIQAATPTEALDVAWSHTIFGYDIPKENLV